jgi:hypothetical protein
LSDVLSIKLQVTGDTKAVAAVRKEIEQLAAASSKTSTQASAASAKQAQAYSKIQQSAAQAATANQKLATETQKTAAASNQAAVSVQKLSTETQRTAAATANAAAAQDRAAVSALRLAQAQQRAADGGNYFKQVGDGVASSIMSVIGPVAIATAAFGTAQAAVQSFADAFQFKAQLDATTLSINAQLQGVRDSSAVWDQASVFAQKFKLTQQETTQAIAASIGVMRASKAPVEDILGVLARMQVLSPEQSLEEAAIALKALASGDTQSLVTRFEVGRDVANQMKAEIQGGADAVAVMGKFLGNVGIGMDVLEAKTTGAAGAIKDLAIAQEELKLAQADFAQGPGLTILEGQIRTTTGATRLLSGDFAAMGQSLANATVEFGASSAGANAYVQALLSGQGATAALAAGNQAAAATTEMLTGAHRDGGGGAFEWADAVSTAAIAAQQNAAAAAQDTLEQNRLAGAHMLGAGAAAAAGQATQLQTDSLIAQIAQTQQSALESQKLAEMQTVIANLGGAVANGLMTASAAAAQLASQYHITTGAAMGLIQAQAALAQAKVNAAALSDQRAGERSPGASGAAESAAKEEARLQQVYKRLVTVSASGGRAVGAARASAASAAGTKLESIETKTGDKLSQIVQDTQAKLVEIDRKAADERAKIAADLANKIATSAADRRASNEADDLDLIGVTDEKEAQKLNDREKAQAAAREREVAAAKEAQDAIANGEAESAAKIYEVRQQQIGG